MAKMSSKNAYSPYSKFKVGSAVLTTNNNTYIGCNVENASYGLTICAERNAIFQMVTNGETEIEAIAIYCNSEISFPPCGACRQVIAEFGNHVKIIYGNDKKQTITNIRDLLPQSFNL